MSKLSAVINVLSKFIYHLKINKKIVIYYHYEYDENYLLQKKYVKNTEAKMNLYEK
jgi:hypothetical protein